MKVSVIIPAWGETPYLEECLASVRTQTFQDIEVLMCAPPVGHENAGAARNVGLCQAQGEWLAFWDADDVYAPEMLDTLVKAGDHERADVVACGSGRGDIFRRCRGWAWDKLFRRTFVTRKGLRFQELPVSNDLFFTYAALAEADKVAYVDGRFVKHRKYEGSVETTRDRAPLAPVAAVRALYGRIGHADGFASWAPEFLFWHINRLRTREGRLALYEASRSFGRECGIDGTWKWRREQVKRVVKNLLRGSR